jgi:hypothetical protein
MFLINTISLEGILFPCSGIISGQLGENSTVEDPKRYTQQWRYHRISY